MYVADRVANLGANVYIVHRFGIITSEDAWIKARSGRRYHGGIRTAPRQHEVASAVAAEEDQQRPGPQRQPHHGKYQDDGGHGETLARCGILTVAQGRFITQVDVEHRSEVRFYRAGSGE